MLQEPISFTDGMMTHLDEVTLTAYLSGALTPAQLAEIAEHLVACPACQRLVEDGGILSTDAGPLASHRTRWSGWLWAVGILTAVLVIGSGIALRLGVGRDQGRNANKVLDVLEGMRPEPVAPNRTRAESTATGAVDSAALGTDSLVPRFASPQARPDSTFLLRDSLPESPATTVPGFERVSHVDATKRYGGPLRRIAGLTVDHYEVGPGGSVPESSPATEVIRVVARADSGLVFLDQQRDPGIAGGLALGVGDTLVTTAENGVTVAIWRPSAVERVALVAALPQPEVMALVRRVR